MRRFIVFFLGGMTVIGAGWLGPRAVFLDFVAVTSTDCFQLYAGRTRIGTCGAGERRIVGQLFQDEAPATLTLVRTSAAHRFTDYSDQLPNVPWNRYALAWAASGLAADTHHFEITGSPAAGEGVDSDNVLANVPYIGDGDYRHVLPPLASSGAWIYRVTPRDNAKPTGNAGTASNVTITADVPPPDFEQDADNPLTGNRFSLAIEAGQLVVAFEYGSAA